MLKEQAVPRQASRTYLDHQSCEVVRDAYQTIHTSGLYKFTFTFVDSLWDDLNTVLHELESLPRAAFQDLLEGIERLTEARNELRLARFLFDLEEVNPVYRLIMRNRALLRSEQILEKVIQLLPADPSSETP